MKKNKSKNKIPIYVILLIVFLVIALIYSTFSTKKIQKHEGTFRTLEYFKHKGSDSYKINLDNKIFHSKQFTSCFEIEKFKQDVNIGNQLKLTLQNETIIQIEFKNKTYIDSDCLKSQQNIENYSGYFLIFILGISFTFILIKKSRV